MGPVPIAFASPINEAHTPVLGAVSMRASDASPLRGAPTPNKMSLAALRDTVERAKRAETRAKLCEQSEAALQRQVDAYHHVRTSRCLQHNLFFWGLNCMCLAAVHCKSVLRALYVTCKQHICCVETV